MIDPRVTDAIRKAAADLDQPPAVADRLLSWLDALTEGNEQLTNVDDTARRCQLVYDAATLTDAKLRRRPDADHSLHRWLEDRRPSLPRSRNFFA